VIETLRVGIEQAEVYSADAKLKFDPIFPNFDEYLDPHAKNLAPFPEIEIFYWYGVENRARM